MKRLWANVFGAIDFFNKSLYFSPIGTEWSLLPEEQGTHSIVNVSMLQVTTKSRQCSAYLYVTSIIGLVL